MGKKQDFFRGLTDGVNLPGEAIPGLTVAELWGSSRVLIEHHGGVMGYCPEEIIIRVSYGQIRITGQDLKLTQMTGEQIIISGRVRSLITEEGARC